MSFLRKLEKTLAQGVQLVPEGIRHNVRCFALARLHPKGGFCGRSNEPDLYYTAFALRTLRLVDGLTLAVTRAVLPWLIQTPRPKTLVDLYSYCQCLALLVDCADGAAKAAWQETRAYLAGTLADFCTPQGGYAAQRGASQASIYQTFLALMCYDLLDQPPPNAPKIIGWLAQQQREDGGFADVETVRLGGTNPTAAAIISWQRLGDIPLHVVTGAIKFLRFVYIPHCGFRAHTRIPIPDLLSTFTALWILWELNDLAFINPDVLAQAVRALQLPCGGFCGNFGETMMIDSHVETDGVQHRADVEYSFYGLACLALLALIKRHCRHHAIQPGKTKEEGNESCGEA
ncbi:hypothetical protein HRbin36_01879 [bacterium HR36]|nr:hypothetical protein HRbin36_01879 [bacterium HR36]